MWLLHHWPQTVWAAFAAASLLWSVRNDIAADRNIALSTVVWLVLKAIETFVLYEGGFFTQIWLAP